MKRVLKPAYRWAVGRLAGRFIAGPLLEDALRVSGRIRGEGMSVSLAFWNEIGAPPAEVVEAYAAAVRAVAEGRAGEAYVSVKLPAAGGDESVFTRVLASAAERGVRVHFDSHGPELADERFALLRDTLAKGAQPLGVTLPGRWRRTLDDAEWAVAAGVFVRVVKGEWAAAETADEQDPAGGCLEVVERLAGARHVSIGTHDAELAEEALRRLMASGTSCDLETLYGRPMRRVVAVAERLGVPVRVYVPYGEAYLDYATEFLRKHPVRVAAWLLRDLRPGASGAGG